MNTKKPPRKNQVGRPKIPLTDPESIVSAAFNVIDKEGFRALTTRRLGRELGVSGAAIYGHFSTMEELHLEMMRRMSQRIAPVDVNNPDWKGEILDFAVRAFKVYLECPNIQDIWRPQNWLEVTPKGHSLLTVLLKKSGVKPNKIHAFHISWESLQHGFVRTYAHYLDMGTPNEEDERKRTGMEYRRRRMIEQFTWAIESLLDSLERDRN